MGRDGSGCPHQIPLMCCPLVPRGTEHCAAGGHIPNSRVLQGMFIWVPFLGFWPKEGSPSAVLPRRFHQEPCFTRSDPNQQEAPCSPSAGPPWLSGGDGWLNSYIFFFCQESINSSKPGGKGCAPCGPLAESPGSLTSVTEAAEKGKTASLWGREQEESRYL